MAPKPMPWFRFYVEAVHDRKLRRLKAEHRWLWVVVLAAARQSPEEGLLLLSEREPLLTDDLADMAALPARVVADGMAALEAAGMVGSDRGCWHVTNWDKRQYPSDRSTERVTKQRRCNDDRPLHQERIVHEATPPETENRDRHREQTSEPPSSALVAVDSSPATPTRRTYPVAFEEFWNIYPRKVGKADAAKAFVAAEKRTGFEPLLSAVSMHTAAWRLHGYEDQFIPHPATWLRQGRWEDDPPGPRSNGRVTRGDRNDAVLDKFLRDSGGAA